jgi:hypothetical protein
MGGIYEIRRWDAIIYTPSFILVSHSTLDREGYIDKDWSMATQTPAKTRKRGNTEETKDYYKLTLWVFLDSALVKKLKGYGSTLLPESALTKRTHRKRRLISTWKALTNHRPKHIHIELQYTSLFPLLSEAMRQLLYSVTWWDDCLITNW